MISPLKFLIIDGYPKDSQDALQEAGMTLACELYANMLERYLPGSLYDILLPSDEGVVMPNKTELTQYSGILWTGCNLCINDTDNPSVFSQIELAKQVYEIGIPSFGSCWGLQIAVVAAGGEVEENPKGREMGIAKKIFLTEEAYNHPMYIGKSRVFDAFISHDDIVTQLPPGATLLSGNDFTEVQSAAVTYKKGTFWATQYHPEYNLHEMASLMVAREVKLTNFGFFEGHDDLVVYVDRLEKLFNRPDSKSLRWQLGIDDDVLSPSIRQCEFSNWINYLVLPYSK